MWAVVFLSVLFSLLSHLNREAEKEIWQARIDEAKVQAQMLEQESRQGDDWQVSLGSIRADDFRAMRHVSVSVAMMGRWGMDPDIKGFVAGEWSRRVGILVKEADWELAENSRLRVLLEVAMTSSEEEEGIGKEDLWETRRSRPRCSLLLGNRLVWTAEEDEKWEEKLKEALAMLKKGTMPRGTWLLRAKAGEAVWMAGRE